MKPIWANICQRAKCKNNLHQIGIASLSYANDNRDVFISAYGGVQQNAIEGTNSSIQWASVGLNVQTNRVNTIWSCPNRPNRPNIDPTKPNADGYGIGYQYYGGIATWNNSVAATDRKLYIAQDDLGEIDVLNLRRNLDKIPQ